MSDTGNDPVDADEVVGEELAEARARSDGSRRRPPREPIDGPLPVPRRRYTRRRWYGGTPRSRAVLPR